MKVSAERGRGHGQAATADRAHYDGAQVEHSAPLPWYENCCATPQSCQHVRGRSFALISLHLPPIGAAARRRQRAPIVSVHLFERKGLILWRGLGIIIPEKEATAGAAQASWPPTDTHARPRSLPRTNPALVRSALAHVRPAGEVHHDSLRPRMRRQGLLARACVVPAAVLLPSPLLERIEQSADLRRRGRRVETGLSIASFARPGSLRASP